MSKKNVPAALRLAARYLPLLIMAAGAALRLAGIVSFPPGLNQDEASAGYDAWAILNYGIDRAGCRLPVLLTAWGSGQNALYSYLAMPFIALLGPGKLALRLPAALLGCASLPLFYHAAERTAGRKTALWTLAALAFDPWHIMLSRWALESNILPFFLLLGVSLLISSEKRPGLLPAAAAAFALALYAYGTAFIFLPFFLTASCAVLIRGKRIGARYILMSAAVFALIAAPVTLCNVRNVLKMGETSLLGLTLPRLTQTRQSETASFSAANFASLLKLLLRQDDGLPWNSPGGFGQLYSVPGLLFALLGLGEYVYRLRAKKTERGEIYVFIALCSSLAASFFIRVNVNRMNMIYLPLIWYQGRGLSLTGRRIALSAAQAAALLTAAGLFAGFYFGAYAQRLSPLFFGGLGEAIEYAEELDGGEIWISGRVNMPYIFALFYSRTPPGEFIESVVYEDPDAAFRQVRAFGSFRFGDSPPPGAVYIAPAGAEKGAAAARFDNYTVARTGKN
ncbi:MAG: glycosyltransferase family 39 protein [Oscillospiraceae bacterium]|nr:glycosyltransferase family 39 protein [Oscillospiraceae bacterium]